jgi:hypothetical protein
VEEWSKYPLGYNHLNAVGGQKGEDGKIDLKRSKITARI